MKQDIRTISGEVADIFAHRFVVATADGRVLADLGPEGAGRVALTIGDTVAITGDMKPSELKVSSITLPGREPVALRHGPKPDGGQDGAASVALRTAEANGIAVVGEPRRKPKHFEVTGRNPSGDLVELHIALDGTLRMSKPSKPA